MVYIPKDLILPGAFGKKEEFINLGDVKHTPVTEEIVLLAGKLVGLKTSYTAPENESVKGFVIANTGEEPDGVVLSAFWEMFDELQKVIKVPLDEPILPDDHPVHQGYLYVVNDGRVTEFIDGERMTVGLWKQLRIEGVTPVDTVRRCDLAGRILRRAIEKDHQRSQNVDIANNTQSPNKTRRRRKTHKIKNMV